MKIPSTYYNNNEDYITIPAIKKFIKKHPDGKFKISQPREVLMSKIIAYAEKENKEEDLYDWIDESIQEGIKDVHIEHAKLNDGLQLLFQDEKNVLSHISQFVDKSSNKHICQNSYTKDFILINSFCSSDSIGKKVTLIFCKKLFVHDKKYQTTKAVDYPVVAEYYIDKEWLVIRAKPRSNLYKFDPDGFVLENAESTTTDKQIKEITKKTKDYLNLVPSETNLLASIMKNKVFNLLDKYTNTPVEILSMMQKSEDIIDNISSEIISLCNESEECLIPNSMYSDIKDDVNNIVEKYLSINWKSKNIFIKDRNAHPIKLSATDEEESKVEQSAAMSEPLQTKAIFFDNKKMLYKSKMCDGVTLSWKRNDSCFFFDDSFKVRISVSTNGICIFKFFEYTSKEDIENVIFSLISAGQDS